MKQHFLLELAEHGWLPDAVVRIGIRQLLRKRLRQIDRLFQHQAVKDFAEQMRVAPLVVAVSDANSQHYEIPAEFFERVLGPRLKYSCALWPKHCDSLVAAEEAMLALTCERAEIVDGMEILELGCGWGSLSLWMAEKFPNSRITAISNSNSQRQFIEQRANQLNLQKLTVLTRNIADFSTQNRFDRIVSVEMFEHCRNHEVLLKKIAGWLAPGGKLFVHIFCHRSNPYAFENASSSDWMARHFFTGGMMPSADLFHEYDQDLRITSQWRVSGQHYSRTCEAWLANADIHRDELIDLFSRHCDLKSARIQWQRWRMFFMACFELFAFNNGDEWFVEHYLLEHAKIPAMATV